MPPITPILQENDGLSASDLRALEDLENDFDASFEYITQNFCSSPAPQKSPSVCLSAPAVAVQEVAPSVERFPSSANCLNQCSSVVGEPAFIDQLGLVSESGDCQSPVLTGHALQLLANELAHQGCGVHGHQSHFPERFECLDCFRAHFVAFYVRAFAHGSLPSRDEVARISALQIAHLKAFMAPAPRSPSVFPDGEYSAASVEHLNGSCTACDWTGPLWRAECFSPTPPAVVIGCPLCASPLVLAA